MESIPAVQSTPQVTLPSDHDHDEHEMPNCCGIAMIMVAFAICAIPYGIYKLLCCLGRLICCRYGEKDPVPGLPPHAVDSPYGYSNTHYLVERAEGELSIMAGRQVHLEHNIDNYPENVRRVMQRATVKFMAETDNCGTLSTYIVVPAHERIEELCNSSWVRKVENGIVYYRQTLQYIPTRPASACYPTPCIFVPGEALNVNTTDTNERNNEIFTISMKMQRMMRVTSELNPYDPVAARVYDEMARLRTEYGNDFGREIGCIIRRNAAGHLTVDLVAPGRAAFDSFARVHDWEKVVEGGNTFYRRTLTTGTTPVDSIHVHHHTDDLCSFACLHEIIRIMQPSDRRLYQPIANHAASKLKQIKGEIGDTLFAGVRLLIRKHPTGALMISIVAPATEQFTSYCERNLWHRKREGLFEYFALPVG